MKKNLLITGGNGYLGTNLAKKFKKKYNIILGSRNNFLNQKQSELVGCDFSPLDVTNIESVRDVVNKFKPEIIIHAAATKFVDLSEKFPFECIDVNILGSVNVARVAIEKNVKIVIGISTDKTAPPVGNIYGLSKATMERLFCSLNTKKTKFACVRFGNISWSTGSVFPIWKKMSEDNSIILSSGYNMYRFFFNINDAVELVGNCLANIKITQGKVLSIKMKSTKIINLLKAWKTVHGVSWKKIKPRKGDKIHEYLIGDNETQFTKKIIIKSKIHYIISFNELQKKPLLKSYSTKNSLKLNKEEINHLIRYPDD